VAEPAHQRRQVDQLRRCGPDVLHPLQDAQGPRRNGVDRQQRGPDVGIALPASQEPISLNRLAGLAIGFIGVAILVGFDPAQLAGGDFAAKLALIGSSVSYAIGGVYARRMVHGLRPMIPALFQVGFALVMVGVLALLFERPLNIPLRPDAILAIVWLGLLGSGAAYLVFFRLLGRWGATRTSLVAYLLPVYGIVLGAIVLSEPIDAGLVVGTALVIGGIGLVNARRSLRASFRRGQPEVAR
jgi:drug/metabolite transporter (DMT)-like permease